MKKLLFISVFAAIYSCKTIDTYHYEDKIDGTIRTVKDDGSTEKTAFWVKVNCKKKRFDWFLIQRERPYLSKGYNYIINDSLYVKNNKRYHKVITVNESDTTTTYFLLSK